MAANINGEDMEQHSRMRDCSANNKVFGIETNGLNCTSKMIRLTKRAMDSGKNLTVPELEE